MFTLSDLPDFPTIMVSAGGFLMTKFFVFSKFHDILTKIN